MAAMLVVKSFLLAVVIVSYLQVCAGEAAVTVTVPPAISAVQGYTATIPCSYTVSNSSFEWVWIRWCKTPVKLYSSDTIVATFRNGQSIPIYPNGGENTKYVMSFDSIPTSTTLTVLSVQFSADEDRYWCYAEYRDRDQTVISDEISTELTVIVLPSNISIIHRNEIFPTGSAIDVEDGTDYRFICRVSGIRPGATFNWTVGSQAIELVAPTEHVIGADQLITSTSLATLHSAWNQNGEKLTCQASNSQGQSGVTSTIIISFKGAPNITNKDKREVGVKEGEDAVLTCIATGEPAPGILWIDPTSKAINNNVRPAKYTVVDTITSRDDYYGFVVTSMLTVTNVVPQDFGEYTCTSENGFRDGDVHGILLHPAGSPERPTNVVIIDRTSSSLTATWTPGYDGGENQWFVVRYSKTSDPSGSEQSSDWITGGDVSFTVTGLDPYTQYVVLVYAQNTLGISLDYGSTAQYTLPRRPVMNSDYEIRFNVDEGTVTVRGLTGANGCIQLEVRYTNSDEWTECGDCIQMDSRVTLSQHCGQRRRRRRRQTADDIEDVRASVCYLQTDDCSETSLVERETAPTSGPSSATTAATSPVPGSNAAVIVSIILGVLLILGLVVFFFFFLKTKETKEDFDHLVKATRPLPSTYLDMKRISFIHPEIELEDMATHNAPVENQSQDQYTNLPNEHMAFPRSQLVIMNELGMGAFGRVLLAAADGILEKSKVTFVAVKTVKEGGASVDSKEDILNELDLQKKLPKHRNIVRLLGFCVDEDPPYIIIEYVSRGNLKVFLQKSRRTSGSANVLLTPGDLMTFAKDVADGMAFLSDNQCIHRDLAARNVLVAEDMTCKIADFGLARDVINTRVYERTSEGRLPIRWMALESILDDIYTIKSDVWSYGILMWEIVTLGARPYPALSSKLVIEDLRNGYRLPMPPNCQPEFYKMMLSCWEKEPMDRPTFQTISKELAELIGTRKECISLEAFEESIYDEITPSDAHEKV